MKKRSILPYLLTGLIITSILAIIYAWKGIFPFGNNSVIWADMHNQITAFYYQLYDSVHGSSSLLINYTTSGGINFWGIMAYYIVSPISLLVLLFPRDQVHLVVSLIVGIKFVLAGLSMLYFLRYYFKKMPNYISVFLSLCYAFCGYNLIMYQITQWMDIVYLFPLLMIGLKKLLDNKSPVLYIVILTISLICSFYLSFIMLVFILLTSLIYLYCFKKDNRREAITSLGVSTVLALAMSAFMILPTAKQLMASSRVGFDLQAVLNSLVGPAFQKISFFFPSSILIVIFIYMILRFRKQKQHQSMMKYLGLNLILLTIPIIIEPVNRMLHFGSYICFPYRYGFIPLFFLIVGVGYYFSHIHYKTDIHVKPLLPVIATVIATISIFVITFLNLSFVQKSVESLYMYDYKVFALLALMALLVCLAVILIMRLYRDHVKRMFILLWSLLIGVIITNSAIYIGMDFKMRELMDNYEKMLALSETYPENEVFRIKNLYAPLVRNYGFVGRYPTLDHFTSLTAKDNMDSLKRLGYSSLWMDTSSEGGTIFTDLLLGQKYLLSGDIYRSDYYEYVTNVEDLYLYRMNLPISYGYLLNYNTRIIDETNAFSSNNNLYKSITGSDNNLITVYDDFSYNNIDLVFKDNTIQYKIMKSLEKATIEQTVYVKDKGIVYLDILKSFDNGVNADIRYKMKILVNGEVVKEEYTTKNQNGILNLGTYENEKVTITIELLDNIELSTLEVGVLDTHLFEQFANEQNLNTKVIFNRNHVDLTLNSGESKILFLPITYDPGFRATLNGNKVEVQKVLDNYIGIRLTEGDNHIVLTFIPEGLKIGMIISFLGLGMTILLLITKWYHKITENRYFNTVIYNSYLFVFIAVLFAMYVIPCFGFVTSILRR